MSSPYQQGPPPGGQYPGAGYPSAGTFGGYQPPPPPPRGMLSRGAFWLSLAAVVVIAAGIVVGLVLTSGGGGKQEAGGDGGPTGSTDQTGDVPASSSPSGFGTSADVSSPTDVPTSAGESNGDGSAKDMKLGLLAIVLYCGALFSTGNPNSMFIALSVAVGSSFISIFGSKEMSEPNVLSKADWAVCWVTGETGGLLGPAPGDVKLKLFCCTCAALALLRGTENVNAVCFSIMFSFCNLESRSRKFSFSFSAAAFFASSAATLSSN